ncbi:MAG TPA: HAD family hydrolase [Gemmatimonadales bacterium]|nr:HAD family hydrolase [Gemmatimonadales bacterium]
MAVVRRGAVFLDRDGTLVRDTGYLHDPALVELLPGVVDGLGALAQAGWPLVVVSNQSGIARGLFAPGAFDAVMARIAELLAPHGVRFAGVYYCPHHPDFTGPCTCRKPGTELFERAARELGLDLRRSWFVGDKLHDVEPARRLGGRGILLGIPAPADAQRTRELGVAVVEDLPAAAALIGPPAE